MERILSAVLLLAVTISAAGCGLLPKEEESPPAPVASVYEAEVYEYTTVVRGNILASTVGSGTYQPIRTEELSFGVSNAALKGVYVELGQEVKAGTLLAEVDCQDLKNQMEGSEHQKRLLELELSHQYDVYQNELKRLQVQKDGLTDTAEISLFTTRIQKLKADYENSRTDLSNRISSLSYDIADLAAAIADRQIFAGIDGIVTGIASTDLTYMSVEKETFITVEDQSQQLFVIDTSDAAAYSVGDTVIARVVCQDYAAKVVDPADYGIDTEGKVKCFIKPDNEIPGLETGAFAIITRIDTEIENVLYIPSNALASNGGQDYVYIMGEDGLKQIRYVTVGTIADRKAEIRSGLSEGEKVILS